MQNSKTFRLFISSTFNDFRRERELLQTEVFPQVKQYCSKKGYTFQPIDLRWGVSNEAQLDQKTLEICLDEVRSCKSYPYPNFLIMIGDRYGWVPLPYIIEEDEFELLQTCVNNKEQITLLEWYQLDLNQLPPSYVLKERSGKFKDYVRWEREENKLRNILQNAVDASSLDDEQRRKYFLSATEAEVEEGIIPYIKPTPFQKNLLNQNPDLENIDPKYIFGFFRDIDKTTQNSKIFIGDDYNKAQEFKSRVKKNLIKENILQEKTIQIDEESLEIQYLKTFKNHIIEFLKAQIDKQKIQEDNFSPLEIEKQAQSYFAQQKRKDFIGREKVLKSIFEYINSFTDYPLVIHGNSGSGKSSLMAKVIEQLEENTKHKYTVIYRFVGASSLSSNLKNMLISIMYELQSEGVLNYKINKYNFDLNKLNNQVKEVFENINKNTIILIDALDQVDLKDDLQWLSEQIPSKLKLIMTILNDDNYTEDSSYFNKLELIYKKRDNFLYIGDDLSNHKYTLLKKLLSNENRTLTEKQSSYVIKKFKEANYSPLYMKIAIEVVKYWKSGNLKYKLDDSINGIINEYIDNLSKTKHIDQIVVDKVLGYINNSKDGLSENELIDLLSEDINNESKFRAVVFNEYNYSIQEISSKKEYMLPMSIWSRMHTLISPFLIIRNTNNKLLMKFFHRQFNTAINIKYKDTKNNLHEKLKKYFENSPIERKIVELTYHSYMTNDDKTFFKYIFQELFFLKIIDKKILYDILFYCENFSKIINIKEKFLDNTLKISKKNVEPYFMNLRFLSYLLGNIQFEKSILKSWEYFNTLYSIKSYENNKYISDLMFRMGNAKDALSYAKKALELTKSKNEEFHVKLYLIRINTFLGRNDFAIKQIESIMKSYNINSFESEKKAEVHQELSFPFHDKDMNEKFAEYNKISKDIYLTLDRKIDYCISGVNEGDGYWGSGDIKKAKQVLGKSLDYSKRFNIKHAVDISLICYANLESSLKSNQQSIDFYHEGINIAIDIEHKWDEIYGNIYLSLAEAEYYNKDTTDFLDKLSKISNEYNFYYLEQISLAYKCVVNFFINKGKLENNLLDSKVPAVKIYFLALELLYNNLDSNIHEIINLLESTEGLKGRPYLIYHILKRYEKKMSNEEKNILFNFKKRCYLDCNLSKIYCEKVKSV